MIVLLFGLLSGPMQIAEREPASAALHPVMLTVPPGRCRAVLNGRPIALARLRAEAKGWRKTQPEIHFMPAVDAEFDCVDRVLRILREAAVTKLGFIGNEALEEDQ